MSLLNFEEPAGILVKTTCVDFPGIVAASFFLKGCNLRCPYCYNKDLVSSPQNLELSSLNDLFRHLEKRKGILKGLTLSGGEALLNSCTTVIIEKAKEMGFLVKLDTNGTLPEKLSSLMENPKTRPDFIAMDIKTSPEKYSKLFYKASVNVIDGFFESKLKESIKLMQQLPSQAREWRTVLVPDLVTKNDIQSISRLLPEDARWQFAQFKNENCISPEYNEKYPYTDKEIRELVDYAKSLIPGSELR